MPFQKNNIPWNKNKSNPFTRGKNNYFWRGGEIKRNYVFCGKIFKVFPSGKNRKYCSFVCYWKDLKERRKGKNNPFYNKFHSAKWKLLRSKRWSGKSNPNWKGGKTSENKRIRNSVEFRLWREAIFTRDNYTCQKCEKRGGIKLHPHHILNFNEYPIEKFIRKIYKTK